MARINAKRAAVDTRRAAAFLAGPAATVAVGFAALWVERNFGDHVIHDFVPLLFGLFTVHATFVGGFAGGLACGMLGWLMLSVIFSAPGAYFSFAEDPKATMLVMAFAFPSVSALVARMRHMLAHENAKLREAESLWRMLAEHVPDAVATIRRDGTVHYANRALPWTGLRREQLTGKKLESLMPDDYRAATRKMIARVFSTGETQHAEVRIDAGDGAPSWYDLRVVPVTRDGANVAALATFSDMTRRLSEEDARQRLIALVNSSNAAIFGTTVDGIITSWNPGARRMYGYSADDVVGKPFAALFPPESAADAAELVSRAVAGAHIERLEMLHRRKDGSPVEVMLNVSPVGTKSDVTGAAVIVRDVGERKRAEAERQRAYALLAEAERVAHVGSWEWDLASDAMTWTDELYRIVGLEPGAIRPKLDAYLSRIDTEDRERVRQAVKKARAEGTPFSFDHRITRPDGDKRILRAHGAVQKDQAGRPVRIVGTVHDVTSFRKLETQLLAQRDKLKEESHVRGVALKESEFMLAHVLDDAPVILWTFDADMRMTMAQGRSLEAIGLMPKLIIGKTLAEITESDATILEICGRALRGETVRQTLRFRERDFHTALTPIRDKATGAVTGAVGVSIDLTDMTGATV